MQALTPNEMDGASRRALVIAVDNNNISIVDLLLKAGANPNLPDKHGDAPLYKSVYWENENITRALLMAGADVNQKNRKGVSPIEEVKNQSTDKIAKLLEAYRNEKRAKQIQEDRQKHEQMKAKARKVIAERKEKEIRKIAAEQKRIEKVEQRKKERAEGTALKKYKVNEGNPVPSMLHAIRKKDADAALLLYNKFKSTIVKNQKGHAVLLLEAVRYEESEMTKVLIENGADCFSTVRGSEHSVLSFAVSKNAHKLVQFILSKYPEKAIAFLNNRDQLLSLQFLAYKAPRMLDILLAAGADPFFGGTEGLSPIVNAIEKASIAILPVLAKHKINLDTRIDGRTPLEWAIFHNKKDWVNGLLAEKVDTTLKNQEGKTPKQQAEELGRKEIAKLL